MLEIQSIELNGQVLRRLPNPNKLQKDHGVHKRQRLSSAITSAAVQQLHFVSRRIRDRNGDAKLSGIPGLEGHTDTVLPSIQSQNTQLVTARQHLKSERIPGAVRDGIHIKRSAK